MAYILAPVPKFGFSGAESYKLYTYEAGTDTPLATKTDSTGGSSNANPVILDTRGEANVWILSGQLYKFVYKDANDNTLYTVDNIGLEGASFSDLTITDDLVVGDDVTIGGDLGVGGNVSIGGTLSVSGAAVFNGDVTFNGDVIGLRQWCQWAIGDQTSVILTASAAMTIVMPAPGSFLAVQAFVNTASTSGDMQFDINKNGSSILSSTKLKIDATEKNSISASAQTTISAVSFAAGDIITFDIDTPGVSAKGPVITSRVRWS